MFGVEIDDRVVMQQHKQLEQAMTSNPKMKKLIQEKVREAILDVRSKVVRSNPFENGDPRQSIRAVRTSVYKKILGANINIYQSRKSHGKVSYLPSRTLRPGQRGGNRIKPSQRTKDLQSYAPEDRGFILRFVNSGTKERYIGGRNNDGDRFDRFVMAHNGNGFRGSIAARHWFRNYTEPQIVAAADILATVIDAEIEKQVNNR